MIRLLELSLLAVAANEEYIPPDDWRAVIALPAGFLIFFGSVFLLLRSNLGTRRAYLVEATCFFGFMTVLSLFWGLGAPGTPQNTGPQNLPGQPLDYYTPKWVPFAEDSLLAEERFPVVRQYPEGFEEAAEGGETDGAEGVEGGAADAEAAGAAADPGAGAEEISSFFQTERGGVQLIGDDWVQDGPALEIAGPEGETVVAATFAKPFALDSDGEIPTGPDGQPLFGEDQVGQPIPEDFTVPEGVEDAVRNALTPERYTAFAFFDPGFAMFPSLVMMALAITGFLAHTLLLAWDEKRSTQAAREEIVIEREPVGAPR